MSGLLTRGLGILLVSAFVMASAVYAFSRASNNLSDLSASGRNAEKRAEVSADGNEGAGQGGGGRGSQGVGRPRDSGEMEGESGDLVGTIVVGALVVVSAAALPFLIALGFRLRARRSRSYRMFRILPGREETASAAQIRDLLASWARIMGGRSRRATRLWRGAPSFALWLISLPREGRPTEVRWFLQLPDDWDLIRAFEGALRESYRDARLNEVSGRVEWATEIVRMKKNRPIPAVLEAPDTTLASNQLSEGFESSLVDGIASAMSSHAGRTAVQYVLTPTSRSFEGFVRFLARIGEPPDDRRIITRSGSLETTEDQASVSMVNQPLFFGEIRVGAERYELARDVAMALSGRSFGVAQLNERRPVLRRRIYEHRFREGTGNPIPSWATGTLSVSEMVALWRLPTPHLKGVAIERSAVPLIPAPPELPRTDRRELALMSDESGHYLTIDPADLPYGVGVQGAQGLGKTALLTQIASLGIHSSGDRPPAVIVVDAKGDLADSALSIVPEGRTTHVVDFGHPEAGIDLWSESIGDFDARTNVILQGLIDVSRTESDESQILASSKEFIVMSCLATLATAERPSLQHMRGWLSTHDDAVAWRTRQLEEIARDPGLIEVSRFYDEFHDRLRKATSAFVQRAAAPHNKLGQLIRGSIDRVLRHPYAIDVDDVIRNREVLIIDGAIGVEREASTVLRFVLQMIHQAIQRQQELPEAERVKVLLIVDEAPVLLTPTVADMMAQDRSAGLMFCAGWQHNGLIENRKVLSSLDGLLGSRFVFRTRDEDARAVSNLFQVSYDDKLASDMADVRRQRIGPATIMNLPRFRAAATQITAGQRSGSYIGETLEMRSDTERISCHLEVQRRRGGFWPSLLLAPDLFEKDRLRNANYDIDPEERRHAEAASDLRRTSGQVDHRHEPVRVTRGDELRKGGESEPVAAGTFAGDAEVLSPESAAGVAGPGVGAAAAREGRNGRLALSEGSGGEGQADGPGGGGGEGPAGRPAETAPSGRRDALPVPVKPREGAEVERVTHVQDAADIAAAAARADVGDTAGGSVVGQLGRPFPSGVSELLVELDGFEEPTGITLEPAGEPPGDRRSGKRLAGWRKSGLTLGVEIDPSGHLKLPRQRAARKRVAEEVAAKLRSDQTAALRDLWLLGYLTGGQMRLLPFEGKNKGTVSVQIQAMRAAGLVDVVRIASRRGSVPYVYRLAEFGFDVGQRALTRRGSAVAEAAEWSPRRGLDPKRILHDLHVSAWLCQLLDLGRGHVGDYRGDYHGRVEVPRVKVGHEWQAVSLESLGGINESPGGVMRDFKPVKPDLTIELIAVNRSDGRDRGSLMIELDRSEHRGKLVDKLRRYDAFYTAWGEKNQWVEQRGWPGTLFVCPDERALRKLLAIADEVLTGHRVRLGFPEAEWPSPARKRIMFALERDLHQRSARAYRVPAYPPRRRAMVARSRGEREAARKCDPLTIELLPRECLHLPASSGT